MYQFTEHERAAIRERRGFVGTHVMGTTTRGGTYIIASLAKWNDSGHPRDLLAVLPGDLGHGRVLPLYIAVGPDLVTEVEEILADDPAENLLGSLTEAEALAAFNEGARRVYCPRCEVGHEGPCKR